MKRVLPFLILLLLAGLAPDVSAQAFVHPGGLHTQADLDRMKTKVSAGEHPWIDGWNALLRESKAQSDYQPLAQRHMSSRQRAQNDAVAAYLNALRWQINGDPANAECAVRILNSWADTVKEVPHGSDQPGLGGISIGSFALAAELLRTCPKWSAADQARFKRMLTDYFYPVCHDFLTRHNGANDDNHWANWDACNMRAVLAIGVFCDDRAKFNEAVAYFKDGRGMGAIGNAVPFRYPDGLGQWQESGRDQAHVMGGMGLLSEMCQVAWNQGIDLFGCDQNRLLAGAEYTAQYNLWKGVPYTFYSNSSEAKQYYISQNYHGRLAASHFELLYNHYVVLKGLKAPHVRLFAELRRPEPGEVDIFGFGTLTYTLNSSASPMRATPPLTPRGVTTSAGLGRVSLQWPPSGAYNVHGYEVSRATAKAGPYTSISSTNRWTTPSYVDADVEPGKTYYYTVAALNNAGQSASSAPVEATPAAGGPLPSGWGPGSVKGTAYTNASGHSFSVPGTGQDLDGNLIAMPVEGDFVLTARLVERKGPVGLMGLMMRDRGPGKPRDLAMTLGGVGGRQARFHARAGDGKADVQRGDDYTWLPVWFRLQRAGGSVAAFQSSDGIEWFIVGKSTVVLPRIVQAGLLVSADGKPPGKGDPAQGLFDNVTIHRAVPLPPAPPASLTATDLGEGVVRLDWANASNSTQAGMKIESSAEGAPFYEIADLAADVTRFENTGLKKTAGLRYRVRAYNRGGYSPYSNPVP
ncbi:MAG: alginate lyase family protein [Verrucomicrobia bacterium]|nr:alginate lyase family protein [Verrucomicrobiota bacterium]